PGAPRPSAALRAGTFGTTEVSAGLDGGGPAFGYALNFSRFGTDGIYPVNNRYRNVVVSGRLAWRTDLLGDLGLSLRFGDDVFHYPTDGAGNIGDTNQRQTTRSHSVGPDAGEVVHCTVEVTVSAAYHR